MLPHVGVVSVKGSHTGLSGDMTNDTHGDNNDIPTDSGESNVPLAGRGGTRGSAARRSEERPREDADRTEGCVGPNARPVDSDGRTGQNAGDTGRSSFSGDDGRLSLSSDSDNPTAPSTVPSFEQYSYGDKLTFAGPDEFPGEWAVPKERDLPYAFCHVGIGGSVKMETRHGSPRYLALEHPANNPVFWRRIGGPNGDRDDPVLVADGGVVESDDSDDVEFLSLVKETDERNTVGYVELEDDQTFGDLDTFSTDVLRRALLEFEREFGMGPVQLGVREHPDDDAPPMLVLQKHEWYDRAVVAAGRKPKTRGRDQEGGA